MYTTCARDDILIVQNQKGWRSCSLCNREVQLCDCFLEETAPTVRGVWAANIKIHCLNLLTDITTHSVFFFFIQKLPAPARSPTTTVCSMMSLLLVLAPATVPSRSFATAAFLLAPSSILLAAPVVVVPLTTFACSYYVRHCCWERIIHIWSPRHTQLLMWGSLFLSTTFHCRYRLCRSLGKRRTKHIRQQQNFIIWFNSYKTSCKNSGLQYIDIIRDLVLFVIF